MKRICMLEDILKGFGSKKILVIGDVMLDVYLSGSVDRISPEAPVPILSYQKEYSVPGGAANVANNILSLGGKVTLLGEIGNDREGAILKNALEDKKISFDPIILDNSQTITKVRVMAQDHLLLRIDYENKRVNDTEAKYRQNALMTKAKIHMQDVDIIVISDYGKDVIRRPLMQYIKKHSPNTKIIVDPKPINKNIYKNTYLVTPNISESEAIYERKIDTENISEIEKMGLIISEKLKSNILMTRGKDGMSLFEKNKKPIHIPTQSKAVFDVSGAGDTVIAATALCITSGLDLKDSAEIANYAAGIVVGKVGTATVSRDEILDKIKSNNPELYVEYKKKYPANPTKTS